MSLSILGSRAISVPQVMMLWAPGVGQTLSQLFHRVKMIGRCVTLHVLRVFSSPGVSNNNKHLPSENKRKVGDSIKLGGYLVEPWRGLVVVVWRNTCSGLLFWPPVQHSQRPAARCQQPRKIQARSKGMFPRIALYKYACNGRNKGPRPP